MKKTTVQNIFLTLTLTLFLAAMTQTGAQTAGRGVYGDWKVTTEFGDQEFESILNFSRDGDGGLTGKWISFWGVIDLDDVRREGNQLTYTQTFRGRDQEWTSKFEGQVEDGKLTGVLKSDRGESRVAGERVPRVPRAAGNWAMTIQAGEREYTGTLAIDSDSEGRLTGTWTSRRGENAVANLEFNRGELSFDRTINFQDNEWKSHFVGNIEGNSLTGVFKSERGEAKATGQRAGGEAIGTWDLELESDRGPRRQRLRIYPDMSALYGAASIDEVKFENNRVSFKHALQFGDREMEIDFEGQIDGDTLTGEVTTGQGSRKVTGQKAAPAFGRNRNR